MHEVCPCAMGSALLEATDYCLKSRGCSAKAMKHSAEDPRGGVPWCDGAVLSDPQGVRNAVLFESVAETCWDVFLVS